MIIKIQNENNQVFKVINFNKSNKKYKLNHKIIENHHLYHYKSQANSNSLIENINILFQ